MKTKMNIKTSMLRWNYWSELQSHLSISINSLVKFWVFQYNDCQRLK